LPGLPSKQLIFVGDLKQLKPIVTDNTRSVMYQRYDGVSFNYAEIMRKIKPDLIDLDEVVRQSDEAFISALNVVRDGGRSEYFRQFVTNEAAGVILAPHLATVQEYNNKGLYEQPGEMFEFVATVEGTAKPEDFSLEHVVLVKNGCKIMYLANSENNPLRNGTCGIFVSHQGCHYIRVGEVDYALERVIKQKKEYVYDKFEDRLKLVELGSITQYPIRLAYALSIHKSQGMTFDQVTVDLRRPCFEEGQMYVALSRVTGPQGLKIIAPHV
jgi:ATP-dependent DNA helicase PIF1